MAVAIVTGASGLVGSEAASFFAAQGFDVVGVDNDMRGYFFGPASSTQWNRQRLESTVRGYRHADLDIRDEAGIGQLFAQYGRDIAVIVHAAAQPSHDWAAREPLTDFSVNATGTLILLEATRRHCPDAVFIFTSTNKVYGDTPNRLPLVEQATRWELDPSHPYAAHGIDESMSVDASLHSVFGASKVAADVMVQEYGRYFGLKTGVFRGGCLTGPAHSGAELHGFLAYLVECGVQRHAVHGVRLQGQAGARQHPFVGSRAGVLAVLRGAAARRGLQRRRRPLRQLLDARGDLDRRAAHRPADGVDVRRHESHRRSPAGGSATSAS